MDHQTFLNLPGDEVARLVQLAGTQTCVFPINGTRRWFMLEHMPETPDDFWISYMEITGKRHVELYQMMFDHGITYLLSPIIGPDILERDEKYINDMALPGLKHLVEHPAFLNFYNNYEVCVRFYGDYRKYLRPDLIKHLDLITERTQHHTRRHLFYGMFANDAAETVAQLSIDYYKRHHKPPDKNSLIEMYYGEPVPPVNLFVSFGKFTAFDMPLVASGNEDLYFMVSPSPYLTEQQLRAIFYDHLYSRKDEEEDYLALTKHSQDKMRAFYRANIDNTLGVGIKHKQWRFWVPTLESTESIGQNQ